MTHANVIQFLSPLHYKSSNIVFKNQKGAVIPLLAILIIALIGITALAVDSTFLVASKSQQENLSLHIALSSLKTFNSNNGTLSDKLLAAKTRAEALVDTNIILGRDTSSNPANLGSMTASENQSGASGRLIPGIWHFQPTLDGNGDCLGASPCPCKDDNGTKTWGGACFEEMTISQIDTDSDDSAEIQINSFRVELETPETTPIRSFFSTIVGGGSSSHSSSATASTLPNHVVFSFNLTRRSHIDTHEPFEFSGFDNSSESSFRITNTTCSALASETVQPCGLQNIVTYACARYNNGGPVNANNHKWFYDSAPTPVVSPPPSKCELHGGESEFVNDLLWNNFCKSGSSALGWDIDPGPIKLSRGSTPPTNPTQHFKDDYSCITIKYKDTLIDTGTQEDHYLVDTFRHPGDPGNNVNPYYGAEPLASILDGINHGLNLIENQSVPGNQVGILAFDHSARVTSYDENTTDGDGNTITVTHKRRRFDLVEAKADPDINIESEFEKLERLTDITVSSADAKTNLSESFFFPRVDAGTNLPQGILVGLEMLLNAQETSGYSYEAHLVLFTDGLSNCDLAGNCGKDRVNDIQPSIDYVINTITPELVNRNIKLHIFHIGNQAVGAHNLMQKSVKDPSRCMKDIEARNQGAWFISDTETANSGSDDILDYAWKTDGEYYFYPSKLYKAARDTGGTWAPIKPQCEQTENIASCADTANCTPDELQDHFDEACANASGLVTNFGPAGNEYTDSEGRLLCSPYDRTTQIEMYMDEIFERNPYVIVE